MGRNSAVAILYLALVFGSVFCNAHNTFSMDGQNRWKAGGKRSDPEAGSPQQNFMDLSGYSDDQIGVTAIKLRELLVDIRDYSNFLINLLDTVRLAQTVRK